MKEYGKIFLHRGMLFGGFGPIVVGVVYLILSCSISDFSLSGGEVCLAIVSTYLLAFIQAGTSVFHRIEEWSRAKALLFHFGFLYFAYVGCYLVNAWIPFDWRVLWFFTAGFAGGYVLICLTVYLSVKTVEKRLNRHLK